MQNHIYLSIFEIFAIHCNPHRCIVHRLNPLFVGTGCVLKSNTRLLSGASMDAHSIMQEHTLVMAGEVVDCGSVWQGWPSSARTTLAQYRAQVIFLSLLVPFWTLVSRLSSLECSLTILLGSLLLNSVALFTYKF